MTDLYDSAALSRLSASGVTTRVTSSITARVTSSVTSGAISRVISGFTVSVTFRTPKATWKWKIPMEFCPQDTCVRLTCRLHGRVPELTVWGFFKYSSFLI